MLERITLNGNFSDFTFSESLVGDGFEGLEEFGPYDVIYVGAAAPGNFNFTLH